MSVEENKAIARRIYEEFNRRNLPVFYELHAANYVGHFPGMEDIHGPEGLKQFTTIALSAFPDYHQTIEDLIAEGDKVVVRFTATATHKGEFMGIAPTGKQATWMGFEVLRIVGGKCVEAWVVADELGMLQQLGVIPTPGQG